MSHKTISHSRPFIDERELRALSGVINSGQLAQNGQTELLEKELSSVVGHRYGVAVSSGTAALYLALRALEIGERHAVIVPSYVCTALLNAVYFTGAKPVIADVDPASGLLTHETAKKAMSRDVRAIIAPHLFGQPIDIKDIARIGVPIIEDCAQCVGAAVGGQCTGGLGRISTFSFYATKLLAAGEGGMIATSERAIAEKIRHWREYDNRDEYEPGFNFKISDVHASLARTQYKKLKSMIALRKAIARRYTRAFEGIHGVAVPVFPTNADSVYFRYVLRVHRSSGSLIDKTNRAGIDCRRPIYKPLHRYLGLRGFPGAEEMYRTAVSVPIYPGLTKREQERVIQVVRRCAEEQSN
jgi:perosamine synthetase